MDSPVLSDSYSNPLQASFLVLRDSPITTTSLGDVALIGTKKNQHNQSLEMFY